MLRRLIFISQLLCLLVCITACGRSGQDDVLAIPRKKTATPLPLQGRLLVFPLDNQHLVLAGNYRKFLGNRIQEEYGDRLAMAERRFAEKKLPAWSRQFFYNYSTAEVLADYWPIMRDHFQKPESFSMRLNGNVMQPAGFAFWINSVGMFRIPKQGGGTQLVNSAELVPFAYLRLPQPLQNGDVLEITDADGNRAELKYHDETTLSRAIKVNQVGYVPDAGEKYAYLGMWMAGLGPLPTQQREGAPFHLRRVPDGSIAHSGVLKLRSEEQYTVRDKQKHPLNGEVVMEMDFSEFTQPGRYYIQVPGVGRSWEFEIGDNTIGKAFYVQMRGLYHQRSGIAKTAPFTQWTMGADHMKTYRGGFAPDDSHYWRKDKTIVNAKGENKQISHFRMVEGTATDEVVPGVHGGWWDAGDYDRRTYHFTIVDALLSIYLLFPEKFSDNQLDLPESGNGIPDIVDEAAWGVEVWRRAQNDKGGVGCWIEATTHPQNYPDPATDPQRYYTALPTRESSLLYAGYAAKLARAYRFCHQEEKAELYWQSARKAWEFAMDPANRAVQKFKAWGNEFTYREPEKLPEDSLYKTAVNFFLYGGDEKFQEIARNCDFKTILEDTRNKKSAYFLSELIEEKGAEAFALHASKYRVATRRKADELAATSRSLAYRNIHWRPQDYWFLSMSWGNCLPFQKGSFVIMAYRITGNEKYRNLALLQADWMYGANPMGRSLTTGLGKVYPVRLLSVPMFAYRDRWQDPFPGITVYTFTGVNHNAAARMIYRYEMGKRPDHQFPGVSIPMLSPELFPEAGGDHWSCRSFLDRFVPVWRRFANLEEEAVDQNEFTVWETIAPAAAGCAALLPEGWKPPPEWKEIKPIPELEEIPGYIFLP